MATQNPPETTPSGRAASALNRLTHGGTSQSLFLKDEDPAEFFALLEDAFEHHKPTNSQDSGLVTDTVLARWFVLRRQKMCIDNEAELHNRKPQVTYWVEPDLHNINLLDRYKTQAERALTRALNNVRHIRKEALAESHWQAQHELQKERFALQRERFELAKAKEARLAAKESAEAQEEEFNPFSDQETEMKEQHAQRKEMEKILAEFVQPREVCVDQFGAYISQDVYVAAVAGVAKVFEVTPKNHEIERVIANAENYPVPPNKVIRNYVFQGVIPEEYKWLITQPWQHQAEDLEIRKAFSFSEWQTLAHREQEAEEQPGKAA